MRRCSNTLMPPAPPASQRAGVRLTDAVDDPAQNTNSPCTNTQRMNQPVLPTVEVIDFDATFTTPLAVE